MGELSSRQGAPSGGVWGALGARSHPDQSEARPRATLASSGASEVLGKEGTRLKWAHSLQRHSSPLETRVKPLQVRLCAPRQVPLSRFPGTQPGRDPRSPPSRMLGPALRLEADHPEQGGSFDGKGRPVRRPVLGSATGAF